MILDSDELNEEQRKAIEAEGNVFLEACPGSGKTRTLTYKIAERLSKLTSKKKFVIAITYTHRAADEIYDRVELLGVDTTNLWIGTIHSFCIEWILKPYRLYHKNICNGFRVINSHESEMMITELCMPFRSKGISYYDCGYYYTSTGLKLNCSIARKHSDINHILELYVSGLNANRQVDFELILKYAYELLDENSSVGKLLASLFSCILVDEFQDTKEIQYAIIANILKSGNGAVETFIVGDSNQAIYTSLGGFAVKAEKYAVMTGLEIQKMELEKNYRSSTRLISYFQNYSVVANNVKGVGEYKDYSSAISYDRSTTKENLPAEIARLIQYNIEELGISPSEICVLAPWWIHLASMTRSLVTLLPEYSFTGPGLVPFARDIDNFWYKLSKILLTDPSPHNYVRRTRWASEILTRLDETIADVTDVSKKKLLKYCNSLEVDENDGLQYLKEAFDQLFELLNIDYHSIPMLIEHHKSFFDSSESRIERIKREGIDFIGDVETFRKVFVNREGVTVSSIHGVKGAEFDTVISYALLDGVIPHFSDVDPEINANKLLYVMSSRARKNLFLISESNRKDGRRNEYQPTPQLAACTFNYDDV
ncbi:MAG: ATP-dependent DNA helicase [Robiginitomaculum sp.]|nr:MAG: ATP-dependent DNA helicase [Robiginitomaculum sp.]